jgi:hypothetical protein
MVILEEIVSSETTTPDQSYALIALRKEYYRRNIEIESMENEMTQIDKTNQTL